MRSILIITAIQIIFVCSVNAQEKNNTPVDETFACSMLAETQTVMSPWAKSFEFMIHHRFGIIKDISLKEITDEDAVNDKEIGAYLSNIKRKIAKTKKDDCKAKVLGELNDFSSSDLLN